MLERGGCRKAREKERRGRNGGSGKRSTHNCQRDGGCSRSPSHPPQPPMESLPFHEPFDYPFGGRGSTAARSPVTCPPTALSPPRGRHARIYLNYSRESGDWRRDTPRGGAGPPSGVSARSGVLKRNSSLMFFLFMSAFSPVYVSRVFTSHHVRVQMFPCTSLRGISTVLQSGAGRGLLTRSFVRESEDTAMSVLFDDFF